MIEALSQDSIGFAVVDMHTAIYWSILSSNAILDLGNPLTMETTLAIAINLKNKVLQHQINIALLDYHHSNQFIEDYHKYLYHF